MFNSNIDMNKFDFRYIPKIKISCGYSVFLFYEFKYKKITWYSRASNPLNINSNKVFKFSGLGAVTKILEYLKQRYHKSNWTFKISKHYHFIPILFQEINNIKVLYPNPTAVAIASPRAADLPRPLAAVMITVLLNVFSDIASMNFKSALPCIVKKS